MAFSSYLDHLIFSVVLVALALLLTWLMMRMRILDVPNVRSSHARPIPNSGGVAIVATVCFGVLAVLIFSDRLQVVEGIMPALGLATTTVVAVGFLDDLGRLRSFKIKLGTQILASCVLLFFNIVITRLNVPFIGQIELGWWGYPITLIWILGLTNIVNFMDGLDGLAGGTAIIAAATFTLITFDQGAGFVYILSYILFAASFGFFVFNFPVAKIFMGDVGSQFLGFVFATIAVLATEFEGARLSFLIMPLLFFHFIFDTVFTFFRRLLAGENVTQAHRSHLYQLMNRLGYSHAQVSIFNFGVSLAQCVGAVVLTRSALAEPGLVLVPFLVFEIINAVFVVRAARRKALI